MMRFAEDPVKVALCYALAIVVVLALGACSAFPDASAFRTHSVSVTEEQGPHHIYARQGRQGAFAPE